VDTDVIINYLKGEVKSKDFLLQIIDEEILGFFSVITEAELLSGALDVKDEASIYVVLDVMVAIEVERDIATCAGKLRRKYYAMHKTTLPDAILAATLASITRGSVQRGANARVKISQRTQSNRSAITSSKTCSRTQ
jgi:predicted nucleic acid-binding protein